MVFNRIFRTIVFLLALTPLINVHSNGVNQTAEQFRPGFHFTPAQNWMNDPNGLVYHNGEYHIFYQHNPYGNKWGHISWGHAVSQDLVKWRHLPVAIKGNANEMIFSGTAISDVDNTSGLGSKENPPLVAIYTGAQFKKPNQSNRKLLRQYQSLAFSLDNGRSWQKYENNPILDRRLKEFRDPKVFWHKQSQKWIMLVALSAQKKISFYASDNLLDWSHLSDFGNTGSTLGLWECPDLFELAVNGDNNQKKWVLQVDVNDGAPAGGSGSQYFVGDFDGRTFKLERNQTKQINWVDYGPDFFAAISWENTQKLDDRRVWVGWHNNWLYAQEIPTSPWRGSQTVPRSLGLIKLDNQYHLTQTPIDELKQLRQTPKSIASLELNNQSLALKPFGIHGKSFEAEIELSLSKNARFDLTLLADKQYQTVISVDADTRHVKVNRGQSGVIPNDFFVEQYQVLLPQLNERIKLRVLVDNSSIELFINNGLKVISSRVFPPESAQNIAISAKGKIKVENLTFWPMSSATAH